MSVFWHTNVCEDSGEVGVAMCSGETNFFELSRVVRLEPAARGASTPSCVRSSEDGSNHRRRQRRVIVFLSKTDSLRRRRLARRII